MQTPVSLILNSHWDDTRNMKVWNNRAEKLVSLRHLEIFWRYINGIKFMIKSNRAIETNNNTGKE